MTDFYFLGFQITSDGDCSHKIKRCLLLGRKVMTNLDRVLKKQRHHHFTNKGPLSQSYSFSISHVQSWKLDYKEGWTPKNWCFQIVVLEKILESPLGSKEIKLVNPKGNQPWIFIRRTNAEAPILGPPDAKNRLTGKEHNSGKDWGQKEKGMTEDEMVGWQSQLNGRV